MNNWSESQIATIIKQASEQIDTLQAELDHIKHAQQEPIAIIGMSCRFPGANSPEAFWQLLHDGVDAITEIPKSHWDIDAYYDPTPATPGKIYTRQGGFLDQLDAFDPEFFRISAREANNLDPQQRLLLEVSWEALERAGLAGALSTDTGVFVGVSELGYRDKVLREGHALDAYFGSGNTHSTASGRLSYYLGITGPNLAIDTACSSSLVSVALAVKSLRLQECHVALAGGAQTQLSPESHITASQSKMLASDGRCKTFDNRADGYVRSEGCGIFVLKRLSDAIADGDQVLAQIRGIAVNHDGYTSGLTVPSGPAQQAVIQKALTDGGVQPDQVNYIEAHGTGTSLGDPIEMGALEAVFCQSSQRSQHNPLLIGSVKTNIGHTEAAAGIAGLIKVVLSMQQDEIPSNLHFEEPSQHIEWERLPVRIPTQNTPWPAGHRFAGVSSFGFSGTNAHSVLEAAPNLPEQIASDNPIERTHQLLTLSAKTPAALSELAERYATYLADTAIQNELALADICYTAHVGRQAFQYRHTVAATSHQKMSEQLQAYTDTASEPDITSRVAQSTAKIAFVCTGQGSQYSGMAQTLYQTSPTFKACIDQCDTLLQPTLGCSLLEIIYPSSPAGSQTKINNTLYTQPVLFALEYALAHLWMTWGIRPKVLLGHSVGELVAACLADVFSLEDGLKLTAARARLIGALPENGSMVSCAANEIRIQHAIADYSDEVSIAAVNGPNSVVISGKTATLDAIVTQLTAEGIKTKPLPVSHAFHSPLMEPMLEDFRQVAESITYHPANISLVSNVTGQLADQEISTPDYWVRHVREAVCFADGIQTLQAQKITYLLEIGPKPTLLGLAQLVNTSKQAEEMRYLPSLRAGYDDWQIILNSLGIFYTQGITIDWKTFDQDYLRRKVTLPTYPFRRDQYWVESSPKHAQLVKNIDNINITKSQTVTPLVQHIQSRDSKALIALLNNGQAFSSSEQILLPKLVDFLIAEQQKQVDLATIQNWLYAVEWKQQPLLATDITTSEARWLIFFNTSDTLGHMLVDILRQNQVHPVMVTAGSIYQQINDDHIQINPLQDADYQQLLTTIPQIEQVVCLWHMDNTIVAHDNHLPTDILENVVYQSCGSLLLLVKALIAAQYTLRGLWLVTQDTQAVLSKDTVQGVAQSPLWGMGKVIALEHPELHCKLVDLSSQKQATTDPVEHIKMLISEMLTSDEKQANEEQIALRDGSRYVARLVRHHPETELKKNIIIQSNATYLITGGLGGLGLKIAEWLITQGACHLMLMGRSSPKPDGQSQIDLWLEQGITITVVQADVSQQDDIIATLERIIPAYPLRGIIHAAGVLADNIILNMNWAQFQQVLAPKVLGAWHLHTLTKSSHLDFFVMFSSISGLLGNRGQANYAAANVFLNGLTHLRKAQGLPALSIDWGAWSEVGMSTSSTGSAKILKAEGYDAIKPTQGVTAFDYMLRQDSTQVGIMPINWSKFFQKKIHPSPFFTHFLMDSQGQKLTCQQKTEAETVSVQVDWQTRLTETMPNERIAKLCSYLKEKTVKILGYSDAHKISLSHPWAELGMDSLMSIDIKNQIERDFNITIPMTELIDKSIKQVAEFLNTEWVLCNMRDSKNPNHLRSKKHEEHSSKSTLAGNLMEEITL